MSSRGEWLERRAPLVMVLPAVLLLLAFSLFPLIISAWLAVSRFRLEAGGYNIRFVGLRNFTKLLFGSEQYHFLGTFGSLSILDWVIFLAAVALLARWFWRYLGGPGRTLHGFAGRTVTITVLLGLLWIALSVAGTRSGPGTLITTLFYVVAGVSAQFLIGLGLAWLCSQRIRGRTFFRLIFFLPLMVTPVGIGYTFRMVADMSKGPFAPIWQALGVGEYSWAADAWSARWVVTIGETWQWVPFMFIVLLAAIESQPREQVEAAAIDGAGGWEIFRDVTWPTIAPVAATVILIRLIEAFKIIDLPNLLTNGGPGIATESMTLHAFIAWRSQQLGQSAAIGYMLLFVAVVCCVSFFNFVAQRTRAHEVAAK